MAQAADARSINGWDSKPRAAGGAALKPGSGGRWPSTTEIRARKPGVRHDPRKLPNGQPFRKSPEQLRKRHRLLVVKLQFGLVS